MSVPPAGRQPSSTPPSKGRRPDDTKKGEKEFKLPPKKQHVKEKEEKKKGLFDIAAAEEMVAQEKQQNLSQEMKAESVKVGEVSASEAVGQMRQVSQLIQQMVGSMRIGQLGGKDFASLDLKAGAEVPESFAGSHLTISYQENGIVIHFDNFSPQQQNMAITLVENNPEQLRQLVQALNAKHIQVVELSLGTHTVALPRVAPLPPPFQPPPATQAEAEQQRERGGGEREGGEEGGRGGPH
jgi:hypothetical protein